MHSANPVKYFAALLYRDNLLLTATLNQLVEEFSAIDIRSCSYPFTDSDYYQAEMGEQLHRVLISFSELIAPDRLIEIKQLTARLEDQYRINGRRQINIDPGYLDLFKVVLASYKGRGNKLYLGAGVWADMTLYYRNKTWQTFDWSFPDFKSGLYNETLSQIRNRYKHDLTPRRNLP